MTNHKTFKKKPFPASKVAVPKKTVPSKTRFNEWYWVVGLMALTFIVFFPAINNALTNWDDPKYIQENPLIRNLNVAGIKRIFSEIYFGNYQPLHILSYAIEYHFYKLNPAGYHATSVVMHVVATGLVLWFVFLLTENSTIALITALLFGIHPMHVESVAWAAERKDLLYAIFFLASLIMYVKYIRSNEKIKYIVYAFLFFTLSILSKAMASSLPPVLILIDIYFRRKLNLKIVLEKIPFFALAVVMGLVSIHAASTTNSISGTHVFSLFDRILIANFNLLAYIGKLILPVQLSAYYPYPARVNGHFPFYFYVAPVVVLGLVYLVIRSIKKTKIFFFGAGFFVVCIFLVLQLLPVGPTIMAERYSYVPSIGFFFLLAWSMYQLVEKNKSLKTPVYGFLIGYSLFLSVATFRRCDVWKDSLALWNDVLEQFPHVGTALNNRGNIYGKEMGQIDLAMDNFNQSIQFEPDYENAYANRGIVFAMRGQFDLALKDFNKALELKPNYYEALVNRAIVYAQLKEFEKAITDFNAVISFSKDDASVYVSRGTTYSRNGKLEEALADFNTALSINPSFPDAYFHRSTVYYNKGQFKEAYADLQTASSLGFKVEAGYFETIKRAAEKK